MRWMTYIAAISLMAAKGQDDPYALLKLGDRVEVAFFNGNTIVGELIVPPEKSKQKVTRIDYTTVDRFTLDLEWEYPGLTGTVTIRKDQLKSIRKLRPLDPATRKRLEAEKEKARAELARREAERRRIQIRLLEKAAKAEALDSAARSTKKAKQEEIDRLDAVRAGLTLLARYPAPEWGPERYEAIQKKKRLLLPLTEEERDFHAQFVLWKAAFRYQESRKPADRDPAAPSPEKPVTIPKK